MNTLKSQQVGDIGIRSLLGSKNGWSQGIVIVFSFGRRINGLLEHAISNSYAHADSIENPTAIFFFFPDHTRDLEMMSEGFRIC